MNLEVCSESELLVALHCARALRHWLASVPTAPGSIAAVSEMTHDMELLIAMLESLPPDLSLEEFTRRLDFDAALEARLASQVLARAEAAEALNLACEIFQDDVPTVHFGTNRHLEQPVDKPCGVSVEGDDSSWFCFAATFAEVRETLQAMLAECRRSGCSGCEAWRKIFGYRSGWE
jgi:hypothetical protein